MSLIPGWAISDQIYPAHKLIPFFRMAIWFLIAKVPDDLCCCKNSDTKAQKIRFEFIKAVLLVQISLIDWLVDWLSGCKYGYFQYLQNNWTLHFLAIIQSIIPEVAINTEPRSPRRRLWAEGQVGPKFHYSIIPLFHAAYEENGRKKDCDYDKL